MKSVCVVTSTRADYGLLTPLIRRIANDAELELRLLVTGTHLVAEQGMTVREIESDGFEIAAQIPIMSGGDAPEDVSATMANALNSFGAYFAANRPDIAVVLGDRYEMLAICAALVNARIPIAHLHGGETTQGAVDECFRHGITKMAYLHFTANEAYRKRVIQLGEAPERVFNVGALGVENALNIDFISKDELCGFVGLDSRKPYAVVTFHPVTLEDENEAERACDALIGAMDAHAELQYLCTRANADAAGGLINARLEKYAGNHGNCVLVASLGMRRYLSALKYASLVLGNSSSGIAEAPSFKIPTVNIGDRQLGRLRAESVIDCESSLEAISAAMDKALSDEFRHIAANAVNPYGAGDTSLRIVECIKKHLCVGIDLKKKFYDIEFEVQE